MKFTTDDASPGPALKLAFSAQLGKQRSTLLFEHGRLTGFRQFDGGEYALTYHDAGPHAGLLQSVRTPNGLTLGYHYDRAGRLSTVDWGSTYKTYYSFGPTGCTCSGG